VFNDDLGVEDSPLAPWQLATSGLLLASSAGDKIEHLPDL
jgi:hypothetical protein